jgi:hypothetical protein
MQKGTAKGRKAFHWIARRLKLRYIQKSGPGNDETDMNSYLSL